MKGNKKVLVVALLLLLISVSFTTYAIYRTSMSGQGSITAANWQVKFKDKNDQEIQTLDFTASDVNWTSNPSKVAGKIAPGATGTLTFKIDATGSEVDVYYLVELGANAPEGISVSLPSSGEQLIQYNSSSMVATVTLTVTWNGEITDSADKDSRDISLSSTNISIPIKVTARQGLT